MRNINKYNEFNSYFDNLFSNIQEGLNNPIPVNWEKSDDLWIGNFDIDTTNYEITIENISKKQSIFLFKFTANNSYELLSDVKKSFSTIPTIKKAAIDFISEKNPDAFLFFASDNSNSRKRFYTDFCTQYEQNSNYNYRQFPLDIYVFYTLYKTLDDKDFNMSINNLIIK
mgnify:CR=1 FL=1